MKKKILKMLAFSLAVCLLIAVVLFANLMLGNPVSKALAQKNVQEYLSLHHAGEGYEIESIVYNWYNTEYIVKCAVPGSLDLNFQMDADCMGNIKSTTYENDILLHGNIKQRLNHSYFELYDAEMNSLSFSFDLFLTHFSFAFVSDEDTADSGKPSFALYTEELQPDYNYDIRQLAAECGHLTVICRDEEISVKRLCEILLELKNVADAAGIPFYVIDCMLHQSDLSDEAKDKLSPIEVFDFLYNDIYEDGLEERVRLAIEK